MNSLFARERKYEDTFLYFAPIVQVLTSDYAGFLMMIVIYRFCKLPICALYSYHNVGYYLRYKKYLYALLYINFYYLRSITVYELTQVYPLHAVLTLLLISLSM